jgi:predicted AAA+ superfamily ATPase
MITRTLHSVFSRFERSILLLGPRQVGKRTLIRLFKPDLEINLNDLMVFAKIQREPSLVKSQVLALKARTASAQLITIFIDETQKLPQLLDEIQLLIDEDKFQALTQNVPLRLRFLISGSSARKLKRGNANLLPGRILVLEMSGLSLLEVLDSLLLGEKSGMTSRRAQEIAINQWIQGGFLPEHFVNSDLQYQREALDAYVSTYLKEEILAEALTRNIQGFTQFLAAFAQNNGLLLDVSKPASKSKLSRSTAARFVEVLEDTLLVFKVRPYQLPMSDGELIGVQHARYFFFDPGVHQAMLRLEPSSLLQD